MLRTKTMAEKKPKNDQTPLKVEPTDGQPKKMMTLTEEKLTKNNKIFLEVSESMKELTTKREEDFSDISFSISNTSDINELYEKMSNKSNDKFDIVYEGNAEEVDKQLNEFVETTFLTFNKERKGFEPEVKALTQDFYQDLCGSIVPDMKPNRNMNTTNDNKSKTTNLFTKAPQNSNISQDEQAVKLRNDLSGVPIMIQGDITTTTGYGKFGNSKLKESDSNKQTISSRDNINKDEDVNVEVKKKKKGGKKKSGGEEKAAKGNKKGGGKDKKNNVDTEARGGDDLLRSEASSQRNIKGSSADEDAKDLIRDSANASSNM